MKIKVVQPRLKTLDVKSNYDNMVKEIMDTDSDVNLIVFPANVLLGKMHGKRIFESSFLEDIKFYQNEILKLEQVIPIVWGGLDFQNGQIFEVIYFKYGHELKKIYKRSLNNGTYFNDSKYYAQNKASQGLVILNKYRISISYFDDFTERESDVNLVLDSSFWYEGVEESRLKKLGKTKAPSIYLNHVGIQNNGKNVFVFDGGSFVSFENKMHPIFDNFKAGSLVLDSKAPIPSFERKENTYGALSALLGYYDEEVFPFKPKWIVGVSGGLDSSVSLALLTRALGKERVLGVTMPSRYNKQVTQDNAINLTRKLGVELLTILIEDLAKTTVDSLKKSDIDGSKGLAYENIQARLRGHVLMSVSSLRNGVVMNNGNKLEVAFGYATMYGDSIGALSILGDLNKLQVSKLGKQLNEYFKEEVVPKNLLAAVHENKIVWDFAPSAELAQDQLDPMKWGYHDYLIEYLMHHSVEEVMELYESGEIYNTKFGSYIKMYGLEDSKAFIEDLDWVVKQFYGSVYKRIQMPPIAVMSLSAFGTGYVETQDAFYKTRKYWALRDRILKEANA